MQVSVETTTSIERRLTIGVPAEKVESEIAKRLQDTARRVRLNGFRPGKAPMSVVKQRYGEGVRQEVVGEIMRNAYVEALSKESLNPAGYPRFEPKELGEGKDLEFVATLEVYPEVALADLSDVELVRESAEVTEQDVDNMIENLRKQQTSWQEVDRAAQDADQLTVAYEGTIDGEAFQGGSAESARIVLGSGRMIPGFEAGLVGANAGEERTLELTFPEDYHAEQLKGKAARFKVTVSKVEEPVLPEVNDEFYAGFGVTEGGAEAFREEVRRNMEREVKQALTGKLKQQVVDALIAKNELEVPKSLVASEIDRLREDAVRQFGGMQLDPKQLPAELFQEQAQQRVKTGLLFAEVSKQNSIRPTSEQVDAKILEIAGTYQEPEEVVKYYNSNAEQRTSIEAVVLEDLVVDFLTGQVKLSEQSVSYEDAIKNVRQKG